MTVAEESGGARPVWRRFWPVAAILAVMAAGWALGLHRHLTFAALVDSRASLVALVEARPVASLLAYVVAYVVVVALSLPGAVLMTLAGGFLFGWAVGAAATVVGATLGATLVFLAARTAAGDMLAARAGPGLARLAEGFRADSFNYLLFLRLVPLFPFWLVNLAPALFGMRLGPYALATAIGILPGSAAFSVIGAGLDRVIAETPGCAHGAPAGTCSLDVKALVQPELLAGLAALGVVALIPVAWKALAARRAARTPPR